MNHGETQIHAIYTPGQNRGETSGKYLDFIHFIHVLALSLSFSHSPTPSLSLSIFALLHCLNTDLINGPLRASYETLGLT